MSPRTLGKKKNPKTRKKKGSTRKSLKRRQNSIGIDLKKDMRNLIHGGESGLINFTDYIYSNSNWLFL